MIISICGFQGAGKDTLANILIEKYGFVKISFASTIKDIAAIIFDWDRNMIEGDTIESRKWREQVDEWWSKRLNIPNLTPRYILQHFGTELFRTHFHQDIWVACVEKKLSKYKNVVITDCRFPNEINTVRKFNSKLIHIYRGNLPEWFNDVKYGEKDPPCRLHASESSWIKNEFDYQIENNGTIKELENKLIDLKLFEY